MKSSLGGGILVGLEDNSNPKMSNMTVQLFSVVIGRVEVLPKWCFEFWGIAKLRASRRNLARYLT